MAFAQDDNATTTLLMMGMVTVEDLQEDEDYQDILDEVKEVAPCPPRQPRGGPRHTTRERLQ